MLVTNFAKSTVTIIQTWRGFGLGILEYLRAVYLNNWNTIGGSGIC